LLEHVSAKKTRACLALICAAHPEKLERVLVIGCGTGLEAGILARELGAETIGVDIGNEFLFDHEGAAPADLRIMDAEHLEFPNNSFDLVYSFHALEHIDRPIHALQEMRRVLKPGGVFFVGTPNKSRLVGYWGAPARLRHKIYWNLVDLGKRLKGQWRNETGAHAGFTQQELMTLCRDAFGTGTDVTYLYYQTLFSRHRSMIRWVAGSGIGRFLLPCVYMLGEKD